MSETASQNEKNLSHASSFLPPLGRGTVFFLRYVREEDHDAWRKPYCGEPCSECGVNSYGKCNSFTTQVIRDYLDQNNEREGWMSTYLKFEQPLVNHKTTYEERVKIWNSLFPSGDYAGTEAGRYALTVSRCE